MQLNITLITGLHTKAFLLFCVSETVSMSSKGLSWTSAFISAKRSKGLAALSRILHDFLE